jgi:uncharacterized protein YodC (DUF2158 family)
MNEFSTDKPVQLLSGGPEMTYLRDDEHGNAVCCWLDKNSITQSEKFPKSALRQAPLSSGNVKLVRS